MINTGICTENRSSNVMKPSSYLDNFWAKPGKTDVLALLIELPDRDVRDVVTVSTVIAVILLGQALAHVVLSSQGTCGD